ncbi:MAG TPA: hypothetical protein ENK29_05610 [Chromatiales bacterium]|nr:hypothetical protein [Chromatiales bacterium]
MPTQRTAPLLAVLLLSMIFGVAGCGESGPVGPTAEEIGETFYAAVKSGDFATAADLFQDKQPRDQVIRQLEANQQRLGDLQSYKFKDIMVNTVFSGVRYILRYNTQYSSGTKATEGLILFQPVSDNVIRIEVHNVQTRRPH